MPPWWVPFALQAGGSLFSNIFGSGEDERFNQMRSMIEQFIGQGPTGGERAFGQFAQGGLPNLPFLDFNLGQDGIMQSMRSNPLESSVQGTFREMIDTGSPFDTSEIFESLMPLRERRLESGLAQTFAQSPGLGQRFGSATRRAAGDVTERHLQDAAALDAQIGMQAHEAAQGRRLAGTDLLLNNLLSQSQLGLQAHGLQGSLLNQFAGLQQGRRGMEAGLLGSLGGAPFSPPSGLGQGLGDIGQLMMLMQLFEGQGGQGGGGGGGQGLPWWTWMDWR